MNDAVKIFISEHATMLSWVAISVIGTFFAIFTSTKFWQSLLGATFCASLFALSIFWLEPLVKSIHLLKAERDAAGKQLQTAAVDLLKESQFRRAAEQEVQRLTELTKIGSENLTTLFRTEIAQGGSEWRGRLLAGLAAQRLRQATSDEIAQVTTDLSRRLECYVGKPAGIISSYDSLPEDKRAGWAIAVLQMTSEQLCPPEKAEPELNTEKVGHDKTLIGKSRHFSIEPITNPEYVSRRRGAYYSIQPLDEATGQRIVFPNGSYVLSEQEKRAFLVSASRIIGELMARILPEKKWDLFIRGHASSLDWTPENNKLEPFIPFEVLVGSNKAGYQLKPEPYRLPALANNDNLPNLRAAYIRHLLRTEKSAAGNAHLLSNLPAAERGADAQYVEFVLLVQ